MSEPKQQLEASVALEVAKAEPLPAIQSESSALISMIERAARDPSVNIDKMERLFEMQQRAMASSAKTAFLAALAELQADLPAIERKGKGHNSAKYARFEDLIEGLREPLSRHGFSLTFRTEQPDGKIKVTGVLGHRAGHSEQTDLILPADTSGNKNAVQAFGSSVAYGKRYVTLTLTGIATEDEDDDGKKAGDPATVTDEQAGTLREMIESVDGDLKQFLAYFKVSKLADLPAAQYDRAITALRKRAGQ